MSDELIKQKLSELIKIGEELRKNLLQDKLLMKDVKKFQVSADNLLLLRFGNNSRFYNEFVEQYKLSINSSISISSYYAIMVSSQIGILEAALYTLRNGLTEDIFYHREILVFSDMLDQAFEFLSQKFDLAAAMYRRVVLEATIKEFAKKNNIDTNQRFDQIIINLRQNGLIHKPLENSLRANYEIGTWAAHGDDKINKVSSSEINEFLSFIRDKVLTLN